LKQIVTWEFDDGLVSEQITKLAHAYDKPRPRWTFEIPSEELKSIRALDLDHTKSDLIKSNWETIQNSKSFGSEICQSLIGHRGEECIDSASSIPNL
jgi:hypothetical protein